MESGTKDVSKKEVIDFYDVYAGTWDERFKINRATSHFFKKRLNIIKKFANFSGKEKVLEVGCGTAFHLAELSPFFLKGIGTDASEKMLEIAKRKSGRDNLQFILDDSEKLLKFSDNSFDIVFFVGLLEHLINPLDCFQNCLRVLKPGGKIIGITPNKFSPWYHIVGPLLRGKMKHLPTDKFYSAGDISALLNKSGFKNKYFEYWGFIPAGDFPDFIFNIVSKIEPVLEKSPLKYLAGGIAFGANK